MEGGWLWIGLLLILPIILYLLWRDNRKEEGFDFDGKHVLITGGSSGLGRELAHQLILNHNAKVTIVARRKELLERVVEEIATQGGPTQRVSYVQGDVKDALGMSKVLERAETQMHHPIDMIICCAGAATPGFFYAQELPVIEEQMKLNYFGTINTIHPFIRRNIARGSPSSLVMVSSTVGLTGMIGYSQYSPTKFAIRGLAECLYQELKPFNISVHVYFAATIDTPGNEMENRMKPQITKILEEGDISDHSPASRARVLLKGLQKGHFMITSDLLTDLFRCATLGATPRNSYLLDLIKCAFATVYYLRIRMERH